MIKKVPALLVTPGNLHFGQHGSYQNLIIANSHVFFDSEFLLTCKKPSKTGCGAQFCDFRLGSRKHRKKKKLHSHSCFPFVSVVGTIIVRAASTSFGCWSATCSCTHTVPFWDWSVYQTCFYCTGFWEHVFSNATRLCLALESLSV